MKNTWKVGAGDEEEQPRRGWADSKVNTMQSCGLPFS